MATQSTGYQVAAQSVTFAGTQTLNTLIDAEYTNLSNAIDNSTNKYVTVDLELVLGSAAFTGAGSRFELYLVPSVDGTNYGDWTGNVATDEPENAPYFVGNFWTSQSTAAQRLILREIRIPPGLYKYGIRNESGVTTAGSGNTLKWRPHSLEDSV